MNVVMLAKPNGGDARFVEVQGTAEGVAFSRGELDDLLALAEGGLAELFALQAEYVVGAARTAPVSGTRRTTGRRRDGPAPDRLLVGQPGQGREIAAIARRRRRPAARDRPRWPTWSRTPTRSRATPVSRRWRSSRRRAAPAVADDTGLRSTRSTARRACARPATRAEATLRREPGQAARASSTAIADERAHGAVPHGRPACAGPTGAELSVEGVSRGPDRDRRAGRRRLRLRPRLRAGRRRRADVRAR